MKGNTPPASAAGKADATQALEAPDHLYSDAQFSDLARTLRLYDDAPVATSLSADLFALPKAQLGLETQYNAQYRGWYGERWCPQQSKFGGRGGSHRGADVFAPTGSRILAVVGPSRLTWNPGNSAGTWGNHIFLSFRWNDGNNYTFVYAHLESLIGSAPRNVSVSEEICKSDCTGNAGGPGMYCGTPNSKGGISDHVHLELWRGSPGGNDTRIDPIAFLNWTLKYHDDSTCG